jgi:hypothetical protein
MHFAVFDFFGCEHELAPIQARFFFTWDCRQDLPFIDPGLDPDLPHGGVGLGEAVINVGS